MSARARDDPGVHPRTGQAHLRGADVLLQDRYRVPGLAQRPSARLRDGRADWPAAARCGTWRRSSSWPTVRACSPIPNWPADRMRTYLARERSRADERTFARLSLNTDDHEELDAAPGGRGGRRGGPARGRAVARPSRRGRRRQGGEDGQGQRPSRLQPVPRRISHRSRRRTPRWTTTAGPSTRPPPSARPNW